ncbi:hypothetical protein IFM89_002939 [Coptis chinensis]|uniref:Protein transport protein SEC23 n=1 Tax=Coptis chinensis TaxID=261450 RepID=A0A835IKN2_9MAGN|nr:hypothetical protein IFM89_002939 [Coptis chinensis]
MEEGFAATSAGLKKKSQFPTCAMSGSHQVGLAELKVTVKRTGGLVVLAESFGHSVFKDSLRRVFQSSDYDLGLSFNEFAKTAKRLTILMDLGSDNKGRSRRETKSGKGRYAKAVQEMEEIEIRVFHFCLFMPVFSKLIGRGTSTRELRAKPKRERKNGYFSKSKASTYD